MAESSPAEPKIRTPDNNLNDIAKIANPTSEMEPGRNEGVKSDMVRASKKGTEAYQYMVFRNDTTNVKIKNFNWGGNIYINNNKVIGENNLSVPITNFIIPNPSKLKLKLSNVSTDDSPLIFGNYNGVLLENMDIGSYGQQSQNSLFDEPLDSFFSSDKNNLNIVLLGPSGQGKTTLLTGAKVNPNPKQNGLIEYIIGKVEKMDEESKYKISTVESEELYKDELRELKVIAGVGGADEGKKEILEKITSYLTGGGAGERKVSPTPRNSKSSRSHCRVKLTFIKKENKEKFINIYDLAGYETKINPNDINLMNIIDNKEAILNNSQRLNGVILLYYILVCAGINSQNYKEFLTDVCVNVINKVAMDINIERDNTQKLPPGDEIIYNQIEKKQIAIRDRDEKDRYVVNNVMGMTKLGVYGKLVMKWADFLYGSLRKAIFRRHYLTSNNNNNRKFGDVIDYIIDYFNKKDSNRLLNKLWKLGGCRKIHVYIATFLSKGFATKIGKSVNNIPINKGGENINIKFDDAINEVADASDVEILKQNNLIKNLMIYNKLSLIRADPDQIRKDNVGFEDLRDLISYIEDTEENHYEEFITKLYSLFKYNLELVGDFIPEIEKAKKEGDLGTSGLLNIDYLSSANFDIYGPTTTNVVEEFINEHDELHKSLQLLNEEREHIVKGIDACMAACRVKTYMSKHNLLRGNASFFGYSHWEDQLKNHLVKFEAGSGQTIKRFCGYHDHISEDQSEDFNLRKFLDPIVSEDSILITIGILNTKREIQKYTPLVKYFDGGMTKLGNIKELEKEICTKGDIDKDKVKTLVESLKTLKSYLSTCNSSDTDVTMMSPLIESIDQLIDGSNSWYKSSILKSSLVYNKSKLEDSVNDFKENIRMYNETSHIGFLRSFESIARILKDYEFANPKYPEHLLKHQDDASFKDWRNYYNDNFEAAKKRGGGKVGEKSGKSMRISRPKRAYKKESSTTAWVKHPTKVEKIVRTKRRRTRVYRATKKQEV